MDKLAQYRVFVRVAEMSSFIKAAHSLDLPRATISSAVQQLETALGARLLHRTTRSVRLTPDGERLLDQARELLAHADELEQIFHNPHGEVSGRLNIDTPSRLARRFIAPALPDLLSRHPRLQIFLSSTDRMTDPVREGMDCVVRVGTPIDSSLASRPLGKVTLINCAAPDYLHRHGQPHAPQELLAGHHMIGYASPVTGRPLPWQYQNMNGRETSLQLSHQVMVNNAENYIACCQAGLGLIQIPRFDVQHLLDSGLLVEVMPEYRTSTMPVSLLYPHRRQRSRRLIAFADWFTEVISPHLS